MILENIMFIKGFVYCFVSQLSLRYLLLTAGLSLPCGQSLLRFSWEDAGRVVFLHHGQNITIFKREF